MGTWVAWPCVALVCACGTDAPPAATVSASQAPAVACAERVELSRSPALGVSHAGGSYPRLAESESFLKHGADKIQSLGARSIKLFLTNDYRARYPETWPAGIDSLAALAATDNFKQVFSQPFETYALLTFTFALGVGDPWRSNPSPALFAAETAEIQELVEYLLTEYAGSGKTFILQNWESDWPLRAGGVTDEATLQSRARRMVDWLNARQAGVNAARAKVGERGVRVLHSVELNRVLSDDPVRAVTAVLPHICPDAASYSAYEITHVPQDSKQADAETLIQSRLSTALAEIRNNIPPGTPIYLSEFGFPETELEHGKLDVARLIESVLRVAEAERLSHAFYWQVFDNECTGPGIGCRGFWIVRPDGSLSKAGKALERHIADR